jgi:hypothetical protein
MKITVRIKTVYGTETIYPVCENAKRFTEIAGTKTITRRTVDIIRAMGIPVVIESPIVCL